ncbi:MAG: hypothetical protein ACKOUM_10830 [Sphingopyxis sp.]
MMTEARASRLRADLRGRIASIADARSRLNARELVEGVDAIRSLAHAHGFSAVSCIAARLESALARDTSGATLLCYLDALDDAVKLEPMHLPAQQALLASVALRLGR